jgi:hypothetical protein
MNRARTARPGTFGRCFFISGDFGINKLCF